MPSAGSGRHRAELADLPTSAHHGGVAGRQLAAIVVIVASACGGSGATEAISTTQAPAAATLPSTTHPEATTTEPAPPSTTSASEAAQPLASMRFVMNLEVEPLTGGALIAVGRIEGVANEDPAAVQLTGNILDEPISLVADGTRWWDLDDPAFEFSNEDIELFLLINGFIQPSDIAPLLAGSDEWQTVAAETHLGVPVDHIRRADVEKGVDWEYGSLSQLDVWRDETGAVVKLIAQFATGDNEGFPQATWELTERNPVVDISIPGG